MDDVLKERMSTIEDSCPSGFARRQNPLSKPGKPARIPLKSKSKMPPRAKAVSKFNKVDDGLVISEEDDGTVVISTAIRLLTS